MWVFSVWFVFYNRIFNLGMLQDYKTWNPLKWLHSCSISMCNESIRVQMRIWNESICPAKLRGQRKHIGTNGIKPAAKLQLSGPLFNKNSSYTEKKVGNLKGKGFWRELKKNTWPCSLETVIKTSEITKWKNWAEMNHVDEHMKEGMFHAPVAHMVGWYECNSVISHQT